MKNRFRAALLLAFVSGSAGAHDFWIQPATYRPAPGAEIPLTLQVGHGPYRQRSPIPMRRIVRFEAIADDGSAIDLTNGLHPGRADDATMRFGAPGTYVLAFETDDRAQSHLPAIRFNDYLEAEGLTPALERRRQTHAMQADGSERYRRIAKSIVRVGTGDLNASRATRPLGLELEIVPERDPYAEPPSPTLPVRIVYEGRPLEGALVKLTRLENDAAPVETHRTDRGGRCAFAVPREGSWLVNVIWTRALADSEETDFATTFSSLSFGYPPAE